MMVDARTHGWMDEWTLFYCFVLFCFASTNDKAIERDRGGEAGVFSCPPFRFLPQWLVSCLLTDLLDLIN